MAQPRVRIQVFSPWSGDWRPDRPGPPNNVYLRKALEERGLLEAWIEPPQIPSLPTGRIPWLNWWKYQRSLDAAIQRSLDPDAVWLALSPWVYPALYVRSSRPPIVLKTFGFVTYARGWLHRIRMPELTWALRHPPDLWIATDDGSVPPHGFPPPGMASRVFWSLNARPDEEMAGPLPPSPPFRILFVGTLNRLKGADRLLRLARSLQRVRRDLVFWVLGDGPYRPALMQLPNVEWLGTRPWKETLQIYREVHLVLQLNRYADWTLPLVEALHATRGVYSLSNGRGPERLKEHHGVRWFKGLESLKNALEALELQEIQDLHQATEAGRALFPTWQEIVSQELDWILDHLH